MSQSSASTTALLPQLTSSCPKPEQRTALASSAVMLGKRRNSWFLAATRTDAKVTGYSAGHGSRSANSCSSGSARSAVAKKRQLGRARKRAGRFARALKATPAAESDARRFVR